MSTSVQTGNGSDAPVPRADDVAELRLAVELGQLVLHYQPKVDTSSGQLLGVESLVRWMHPTRGVIPPLAFIPLAEESGLIGALGEWVLIEACRQQAEWAQTLNRSAPPVVCVNVSGLQLVPGFVEVVRRAIAMTGAVSEGLCLEVTESAVMDDVETAVAMLHELKEIGLLLSIDDFGTGQSSLSHLQRFPVDELKIDKSFIDLIGKESDDGAIVAAIVAMAHALGLRVIAEGVETSDQLRRLQNIGCDMVQGYLFSRPLPAADVAGLGSVLVPQNPGDPVGMTRPGGVVLIVDDSDEIRALVKASLAIAGFQIVEARNGEEALAQARLLPLDGVVLDVNMPGIDGFEVCRMLRADPKTASAAVVMLTSLGDSADKVRAFSAGADDYMLKPFAPRELIARVRRSLALRAITR